MYPVFLLLLILGAVVVIHEYGHFVEYRRQGIRVERFAIGIPVKGITLFWQHGETTFTLSPLLIAGFVQCYQSETSKIERLSLAQICIISYAGIRLNFITGIFILFLGSGLIALDRPPSEVTSSSMPAWVAWVSASLLVVFFCATFTKKIFYYYLAPSLSLVILCALVMALIANPFGTMGGPLTLLSFARESEKNISQISQEAGSSFELLGSILSPFGAISVMVAALNLLPILPLDGGHVVARLLGYNKESRQRFFGTLSNLAFLAMIVLALGGDLRLVISFFTNR